MQVGDRGIRKRPRVPNACIRCRQQKIKCTGTRPCEQCSKRRATCKFESGNHKILVDARFIARLQRQAARGSNSNDLDSRELTPPPTHGENEAFDISSLGDDPLQARSSIGPSNYSELGPSTPKESSASVPALERISSDLHVDSDSPAPYPGDPLAAHQALTNPLLPGNSPSYTVNPNGQPVYFGTSSNWSFGRRVLNMVHERVTGHSLPTASLLFQGAAYDLGWDGLRDSKEVDCSGLPDADYAMFLINAVKFHCCRLFHIFDEKVFMYHFHAFHAKPDGPKKPPVLWFIHYLLVLAFGKAFVVRGGKGRSPPGAELFVRAMKLLPDTTYLFTDPVQAIEVLVCAALYLQCLDMRSAAFNVIGQAVRLAIEQGLHTDMSGRHKDHEAVERCRDTWWSVYILDRRMSCLMGLPVSIPDNDITAPLPSFSDSAKRSLSLKHHVQLSKATSKILRTVYSKNDNDSRQFLNSMKDALKTVAEGSDERKSMFPLDLKEAGAGICRLSAYLHLFHHQKRLESSAPLKVPSEGGFASLLRVCVSSAKRTMRIVAALQAQGLLDSFLPFDLEATFAAVTVLSLAAAVDESLLRDQDPWLQMAFEIFDEMAARGNVIAAYNSSELQQLDTNIGKLRNSWSESHEATHMNVPMAVHVDSPEAPAAVPPNQSSNTPPQVFNEIGDFGSEDGLLSGNHLQLVAESFDFEQLDYWLDGPLSTTLQF